MPVPKHLQCFVRSNRLEGCWKGDKRKYATHLKPIQVNLELYMTHTTISQIYTNPNSDNIQQRQKGTKRKQENLCPCLSARHLEKSAFFKLSHLALRTFCQAPAGISEQSMKSNSSSNGDWLKASSKSAAPCVPCVSLLKHLQCFVRINLSKTRSDEDKVKVHNPS